MFGGVSSSDGQDRSSAEAVAQGRRVLPEGKEAAMREARSDLIVVGARGFGAIKRALSGSGSEAVLCHATCPVLVVHPRAAEQG